MLLISHLFIQSIISQLFPIIELGPWKCISSMNNTQTKTKVNYNKIKEQIGTVVTDGYWEYVVADYKMGCDAYYLWCKNRQAFYYTDYNAFNRLYTQISGWFLTQTTTSQNDSNYSNNYSRSVS